MRSTPAHSRRPGLPTGRREALVNRTSRKVHTASDVLRDIERTLEGLSPAKRRRLAIRPMRESGTVDEWLAEARSIFECVKLCLDELADPHDPEVRLDCEISDVAVLVKLGIERISRVKAALGLSDKSVRPDKKRTNRIKRGSGRV